MGNWKCTNCGNKNDNNAKFCTSCGTPSPLQANVVVVNSAVPTMTNMAGPDALSSSSAIDNTVGDPGLITYSYGDTIAAKPKSKKKKIILISVIGGTVLIVLVGLYLFFFTGLFKRGKEPNNLFDEDRLRFLEDGKYGYIDSSGKIAIDAKYSGAGEFSNGLAAVKEDEKWGFIDKDGEVKIDFQFDEASFFNNEGYARVTVDKKEGVINKDGDYIFDADYDSIYQVGKDRYIAGNKKNEDSSETTYNLYDDKGHRVFDGDFYNANGSYKEGPIAVKNRSEKYGYIDESGSYVIDAKYDKAEGFSEDLAVVAVESEDEKSDDDSSKTDEETDTKKTKKKTYKYGYINKKGDLKIATVYEDAEAFSDGLAAVKKDGKWGYINSKGEIVIQAEYDTAYDFRDGYAKVGNNGKEKYSYIYGVIDKKGKQAIGLDYDYISYGNKTFLCEKDNEYRFLDENGKYIIDKTYHKASVMYDDGYAIVATDDKTFVVIDKNGKEITDKDFYGLGSYDKDDFCKEDDCYNSKYYSSEEGYCEKHYKQHEDPHNLTSSMWTYSSRYEYISLYFLSKGEGNIYIRDYSSTSDDDKFEKDIYWRKGDDDDSIIISLKKGGSTFATFTLKTENNAVFKIDDLKCDMERYISDKDKE